jgi:uncharacterized protein (DUF924 family)
MPGQRDQASEILEFWLVETRPRLWFAKDLSFDDLVQQRFLSLTRRAIAGELDAWDADPTGALALVLLLDQFPRQSWLMPLMHSEDLAVQEAALPLFERFSDSRTVDVASRHRDVIARFQRFPHRNVALGRVSSAAELAILQTPGSRF